MDIIANLDGRATAAPPPRDHSPWHLTALAAAALALSMLDLGGRRA